MPGIGTFARVQLPPRSYRALAETIIPVVADRGKPTSAGIWSARADLAIPGVSCRDYPFVIQSRRSYTSFVLS
jgi:hypothetical protein